MLQRILSLHEANLVALEVEGVEGVVLAEVVRLVAVDVAVRLGAVLLLTDVALTSAVPNKMVLLSPRLQK